MSLFRTLAVRAAPVARRSFSYLGKTSVARRSFSYLGKTSFGEPQLSEPLTAEEEASGEWVEMRIPVQESTLEWVLSSPPPLHAFAEPPLFHECTEDAECGWHNPLAH